MKIVQYDTKHLALALSREEAVQIVKDLVEQLSGVGAQGSREYVALCEEDPSLNARYAFLVKG